MNNGSFWILIPARGGSRGLPRKNVRLLGGLPLITHVIRTALKVCPCERIVVITDDDEIAALTAVEGVSVMREPQTTGRATLDQVSLNALPFIQELGAQDGDIYLTLQPTCPFLRSERIVEALEAFEGGAGSIITVVDDRHLRWRRKADGQPIPRYVARVNRQVLEPDLRETGAIIGCRIRDLKIHKTRIVEPIQLIEVSENEAIDIDGFADWAVANYLISRREIIIRADAGPTLGMGHVYRALAIAQELAHHKVTIATDAGQALGAAFLSQFPFDLREVEGDTGFLTLIAECQPDLVILDQLDTDADYVGALKGNARSVVTFEDQGLGAQEADLLVSDLYPNLNVPPARQLSGITNSILAPSFETNTQQAPFKERVQNVLLIFGGTDPSHLTEKTLTALTQTKYKGHCTVVTGLGFDRPLALESYGLEGTLLSDVKYMPGVMRRADLAVSSARRTVTELTSLGIPVLCLCQNDKELTHTHASPRFGVISLGLGPLVNTESLAAHIERLIAAPLLRRTLRERALHETRERANTKVISRILDAIDWD